MKRKDPK